jgi:hypothetical protein
MKLCFALVAVLATTHPLHAALDGKFDGTVEYTKQQEGAVGIWKRDTISSLYQRILGKYVEKETGGIKFEGEVGANDHSADGNLRKSRNLASDVSPLSTNDS